jgi:glutamate/tyrosine decarboxylase-like PLP-dependent enzyme
MYVPEKTPLSDPVPPEARYRSLLDDACDRAQTYLAHIRDRRVGVTPQELYAMQSLGGSLPEDGAPAADVLRMLDEAGSPATMATMGGRFFGGVIGGSLPVTVAVHWLADAWDQNACLYDLSPISAYLEDVVLRWMVELFRLPAGSAGALVTGTQMADVTALAAARHALLRRGGWDVESDGLFGAPPISVIVGEEVHATMMKALALLGFGRRRVHIVSSDSQGRMKAAEIPRLSGPVIICAQLGNVNTGSCDPLTEICEIADSLDAWVHIDGAFGLWAALDPAREHLAEGLARAHSWATDAHKWLNVPQDCGVAMVRDSEALRHAMSITAAYYGPLTRREPMQWCPESSRRARGIEVWAAMRTLGKRGIARLVENCCTHALAFARGLTDAGYEVLNDVVLNQVLVSFGNEATTDRVIERIQADGRCWCGGTLWKGRRAMRISVSSWATTSADVSTSLEAMLDIAAQVK